MHSRSLVVWIVRVVVVIALVLPVIPALAQGPDATVVPDTLNMRYGPGAEYAVTARLVRGQALTLLARDDIPMNGLWVWARTSDGTESWVLSDYLTVRPDLNLEALPVRSAPADLGTPVEEPAPAPEAPAPAQAGGFPEGTGIPAQITSGVNFRSGPGTGYNAFYTLSAGVSALAKGRNAASDWVFISVGDQDGWVYYTFIQFTSGSLDMLPVTTTVTTQTGGEAAPVAGGVPAPVGGGRGLTGFGYGGHVDSFAYPGLMQAAGMTWVKRQIRFHRGASGGEAAGVIDQAHANGFKILLGIVGHPSEMGASGYFEDYARFVGEVAALGPDAIEIWNEQNIDHEWPSGQIDAARYTQLLALAYNAIKSANPNVTVISGAPAPTGYFGAAGCTAEGCNDDVYVRGMAAAGAARYMDCIGAHYNEGIISPSRTSGDPRGGHYTRYFWGMVNTYSAAFGGSRPICFTELGYVSPEGFGPLPAHYAWGGSTTVAQQAAWLADAVQLSRSSGRVRLVIIWNVDFTAYGSDPMAGYAIVRPGGSCPACDALARAR